MELRLRELFSEGFGFIDAMEILESELKEIWTRWIAEEWQAYNDDNWVNDASGYLAVCGKLSEEEENDLILQLVQAFEHNEDNRDGIAANSVPSSYELLPQAVARAVQTDEEGPRGRLVSIPGRRRSQGSPCQHPRYRY